MLFTIHSPLGFEAPTTDKDGWLIISNFHGNINNDHNQVLYMIYYYLILLGSGCL